MRKSLAIVLAVLLPISAAAKHPSGLKHYASKECGVSFSYPATWKVKPGRKRCSVELEPATKKRDPDEAGGYAGQCDFIATFVAHDGRWIAAEGHDENFILKVRGTAVFDAGR